MECDNIDDRKQQTCDHKSFEHYLQDWRARNIIHGQIVEWKQRCHNHSIGNTDNENAPTDNFKIGFNITFHAVVLVVNMDYL